MGVAGHEADRAFFLTGFNGKGSHTIDRILRGTVHVANLCLSVHGGIQPLKLVEFLKESASNLNSDGMISRFQLLSFPDPILDWQYVDRPPNAAAKDCMFTIVESWPMRTWKILGAKPTILEYPHFHFDREAQEFFKGWLINSETKKLRDKKETSEMLQHLAKYRGLLPKLALLFHLIETRQYRTAIWIHTAAARHNGRRMVRLS